ncbi:MATE family efflux transporter [Miniphocaeibacter halophilus]|uniref:MATE family efflux transporter n=1 Tax=Miniphocaeibacter halophilus TaxID=2931922 RepID=A0AC61N6M9_9FIRM|nr:MATE family efflux transporter [Miniphocaeibacter halophilus]QQK08138.1 MATE family efflux transporter [Miniphocaeibacter halophilus]
MNTNKNELLGTEPITKLLLKFSIPAIIGMIVNALYNVVDKIFLGQVNSLAIGGVHLTYPLSLAIMAFAMLVGMGGNSLSSIRLGQGRKDQAEKILGNSFTMLVGLSFIIFAIIFFFLEPILKILGSKEVLLPYAMDYMKIIAIGIPFQMIGFGLNYFIRGEGSPTIAMGTMLIGAITNIILDYVFVILLGLGVKGAALATIIGQFFSFVWVLMFFFGSKSSIRITKENIKLKLHTVGEILSLGLSPFGMQIASSLVITIFNIQLAKFGNENAITAMGIVQSISTIAFMPIFGLNQGSQPILGYNYGAEKYERVKRTLIYAIIIATIYISICYCVIMLAPELLINLFIVNASNINTIMPITVEALKVTSFVFPILGFQILSSNYFQATGKPIIGVILSLSRQLIVLLPVLLILPKFFGLLGVWLAYPVSDLIAFILSVIFLTKDIKNLNRNIDIEKAQEN